MSVELQCFDFAVQASATAAGWDLGGGGSDSNNDDDDDSELSSNDARHVPQQNIGQDASESLRCMECDAMSGPDVPST